MSPELLKIIKDLIKDIESVTGNSNADNAVYSTEMKHAVNDIIIGEKLSLCVCQHPTEWSKKTDDAIKKFDILTDPSKPYQLDPNEAKQIKDHIKNLYWWDQVFPKKDNPDPKKLWYFHPVAFIEHLKGIFDSTVKTNWTKGFGRSIKDQNKFNEELQKAAEKYPEIDPIIFKSLIAQESGFDPKIKNVVSFAGLTQVGPEEWKTEAKMSIGNTKKENGVWTYDNNDERFDPEKSILGGMIVLVKKIKYLSDYTAALDHEEKWKIYLAAYNAGQGRIKKALKLAKSAGINNPKWKDLINSAENPESYFWKAMPSSHSEDRKQDKYDETTDYVENSIMRYKQ